MPKVVFQRHRHPERSSVAARKAAPVARLNTIVFACSCGIVLQRGGMNMNRFIGRIMFSAALLLIFCGAAAAEVVKGTVKGIAAESRLFTLVIVPERLLLVSWDKLTQWQGISNSADLKVDEALTVEFRMRGDDVIASSVSRIRTPAPAGVRAITLDQLLENPGGRDGSRATVLVDTRSTELYDAGHIPGAISVPLARLEKRSFGLLPEEKGARLVFYDEGQGGVSAGKGAQLSARAGYSDIAVFMDGAAGWVNSGRFLASSTTFIRKIRPVIIDIRPREQVSQGHIEGAVNYPASQLKEYYGNFPMDKHAPITVYGDSDKDALAAAETIRSWGYRSVTIYPGGAAAWVNSAEVLVSGPAGEQISSPAASHSGKLQPGDFEMALISPVMVEILDVRPAAEQKKSGFPGAKMIPLPELPKRHGELNRDKIQVVFAADAVRAEMAYDFLKSKNYRVNYLNGSVEFGKDGKHILK